MFNLRHFALWFLVCWLSALPSFVFGLQMQANPYAMVLGVMVFIVAYTVASPTLFQWLNKKPALKKTLHATFAVRLLLSAMFGLNLLLKNNSVSAELLYSLDGWSGFVAVVLTQAVTGPTIVMNHANVDSLERDPSMSFMQTFIATMIQGVFLNVVIVLSAAALFACIALARKVFGQASADKPL